MGFFKKNKDTGSEMSDIPTLPDFPPIPSPPMEVQRSFALPTFPGSQIGQRMNQETIKEAIAQEEYPVQFPQQMPQQENFEDLRIKPRVMEQNYPQRSSTMENQDWQMPVQSQPIFQTGIERRESTKVKKMEPLFIKLEKFEHTISTFNEIKLRISEVETLLKNIRTIKAKEEKELGEWEKEIETIKLRLDQIDQEIFKGI